MSGNFFDDDDDDGVFEITPGGDDSVPVTSVTPSQETPHRAVTRPASPQPRLPSPVPSQTDRGRTTLPRRPRANTVSAPVVPITSVAPEVSSTPSDTSSIPRRIPSRVLPPAPIAVEPKVETRVENVNDIEAETDSYTPEPYAPEPIHPESSFDSYTPSQLQPIQSTEPLHPTEVPASNYTPVVTNVTPQQQDSGFGQSHGANFNSGYQATPVPTIRASREQPDNNGYNGSAGSGSGHNAYDFSAPSEAPAPQEEEKPEPVAKGKKARGSKNKKSNDVVKAPGSFAGQRRNVLIMRIVAGALVLSIMGVGVNSVFNPPPVPTRTDVKKLVREEMNITEFPTEAGYPFITAFTREYLTFDPTERNNKSTALKMFTDDSLASKLAGASGPEIIQKVIDGPIVSGVKATSDNDAVYTVGAKISTGETAVPTWLYLDIPVYYNPETLTYIVSGTPAFATPPVQPTSAAPALEAPYSNDTKLASDLELKMSDFFKAWASSDPTQIELFVDKDLADVETKSGLQGTVNFSDLSQFKVEKKAEGDVSNEEYGTRRAQAKVIWASPLSSKLTYEQNYELILKLGDNSTWYVADITGGVRTSGI